MKLQHVLAAGAVALLTSAPAFADTFIGKIVYKNADGELVSKSSEAELTPATLVKIKLKLEGVESIADKVKFKSIEGENRKVVLAVFRNIGDMPEGSAVILKGTLLEGTNGGLFYGDVLTRSCKATAEDRGDDGEDSFLDRMMDGIQTIQDLTGCSTEYRGGILLAHTKKDSSAQEE